MQTSPSPRGPPDLAAGGGPLGLPRRSHLLAPPSCSSSRATLAPAQVGQKLLITTLQLLAHKGDGGPERVRLLLVEVPAAFQKLHAYGT